jgi:hypothetical protein
LIEAPVQVVMPGRAFRRPYSPTRSSGGHQVPPPSRPGRVKSSAGVGARGGRVRRSESYVAVSESEAATPPCADFTRPSTKRPGGSVRRRQPLKMRRPFR